MILLILRRCPSSHSGTSWQPIVGRMWLSIPVVPKAHRPVMHRPTGLETGNERFSTVTDSSPHYAYLYFSALRCSSCSPRYVQYFVHTPCSAWPPINQSIKIRSDSLSIWYDMIRYDMIRECLAVKTLYYLHGTSYTVLVPSTDKICTLARCLIDWLPESVLRNYIFIMENGKNVMQILLG